MTKQGDHLTSTSRAPTRRASSGVNNSYWATWGAVFAPVYPLLAWDITWNEGLIEPVSLSRAGRHARELHAAGPDLGGDGG